MIDTNFGIPRGKKLILFDGICNLCNNSVIKIIEKDRNDVFLFVAIQSETGQKIINYLKIDTLKVDSIILYEPNKAYYIKSEAALKIIKEFSGFWKLMQIFSIFPSWFNNLFYDCIARNRYKWFGKKESCMTPTSELKTKFLG